MPRHVLIHCCGGADHQPQQCAELFTEALRTDELLIDIENDLAVYTDTERMAHYDLIAPIWTMSEISSDQSKVLRDAVAAGAILASRQRRSVSRSSNSNQPAFGSASTPDAFGMIPCASAACGRVTPPCHASPAAGDCNPARLKVQSVTSA